MRRRLFLTFAAISLALFAMTIAGLLLSVIRPVDHFVFRPSTHRVWELGVRDEHAWISASDWSGPPPKENMVYVFFSPGRHRAQFPGFVYEFGRAESVSPDGGARCPGPFKNLAVSLWPLLLASAVLPITWLWRTGTQWQRDARTARQGRCPRCGYDLRATPNRCPECGTVAPR